MDRPRALGIGPNLGQFVQLLLQVLFVGLTIGMMRTVVPALADTEFGLERGSFVLLTSFVVAFGLVKGALNFLAGRLSEHLGRKRVLLLGWIAALPIPPIVLWGPDWSWIVLATVLLGINQGMAWSMTQTAKLDISRAHERGFAIGLNEFAGYVGVAAAGVITAYLAGVVGPREGVAMFGLAVIVAALALTVFGVTETRAWTLAASGSQAKEQQTTWSVFARVTWRDRRLFAVTQAGLVEKFVDALVWVLLPPYLLGRGLRLSEIGWVVGAYGLVWGVAQLATGRLSDRIGRHTLNVAGMWICGAAVAAMLFVDDVFAWAAWAAVTGLGMAMLYPNLSAAVADMSDAAWRGTAIGVYRFWRDTGYAVGAFGMGVAAHAAGVLQAGFWFVAVAMALSGAILAGLGGETRPRGR